MSRSALRGKIKRSSPRSWGRSVLRVRQLRQGPTKLCCLKRGPIHENKYCRIVFETPILLKLMPNNTSVLYGAGTNTRRHQQQRANILAAVRYTGLALQCADETGVGEPIADQSDARHAFQLPRSCRSSPGRNPTFVNKMQPLRCHLDASVLFCFSSCHRIHCPPWPTTGITALEASKTIITMVAAVTIMSSSFWPLRP